jgi:hypothetical protein
MFRGCGVLSLVDLSCTMYLYCIVQNWSIGWVRRCVFVYDYGYVNIGLKNSQRRIHMFWMFY